MKKQEEIKRVQNDVNQHILNIITPSGIDHDNTHANIGENYGRIMTISRYPVEGMDYGWLAPLCNLEGTSTTVEYRYVDSSKVIEVLNRQISDDRADRDVKKDESEKQQLDQAIKSEQEMIHRLAVLNEPVGYVNIMIHIQAATKQDFENRYKKVSARVAVSGCNLRCLKYKQLLALESMAPYGIPKREVSNMGARPMPLSTLIGGFPMAANGIYDPNGYFIGKTRDGKLIILNMWMRNKDRVNSNWYISGLPGVGKSSFLKDIFVREFAFGTKIMIFDIEEEYTDLAKDPDINGEIIDCAGGPRGRINPLQVRYTPRVTEEDLEKGEKIEDFVQYDENLGVSDLALHIQNLRIFFKLYFGAADFTVGIRAALEECLIEAYKKKGILWDTDISKLKPDDYPIISDVYEIVLQKCKESNLSEYKRSNYDKLKDMLYSAAEGADKYIWNGPTTVTTKTKFIVFNTSKLMDLDEKVRNAQFYNLEMYGWHEMSKDRTEKVLLAADEGYNYVDPEYPELMKYFRNVSKRDRKYEGSLMFITHSVVDILDPAVKRFGQAIIDNACYKFIMGCDGKNLDETKNLLKLTEKEEHILEAKNRGEGILFAGNVRVDAKIEIPEKFLKMFGTAGGR